MSIHVHKTGLNKTLGQQSDAIVTANLVGNWDPSLGINAGYWENQVSGGNHLRRFNGITHNNSTPHNFEFDGSDDYLGEAAGGGYGGTPFTLNVVNAWTIATWVKYNNVNTYPFFLGGGDAYIDPRLTGGTVTLLASDAYDVWHDSHDFPFEFSDDTWYYVAITYNGDAADQPQFKMYVNGSFDGCWTLEDEPDFSEESPFTFHIGENQGYYNGDGTKVGHVHVYTAELTNSQLRQNFLATHKMNSDRIYGDTLGA